MAVMAQHFLTLCVKDRHRSREFVVFLEKLDAAYPTETAIKIILGNRGGS